MAPTDPAPSHIVLEAVTSSTIEEWIDINNHTFSQIPSGCSSGFLNVFYPKGVTPEIAAWNRETHVKAIESGDTFYFIVRDVSSPSKPAIGAARWQLVTKAKSAVEMETDEAQASKDRAADRPVDNVRYDRFEEFRVAQYKSKKEHLAGRPYLYLKSIATHPDHQRKGAGKVMMRWGLRKADDLGVPAYLEASEAGRRLYEQSGFEAKGYLDWDAKKFDGINDSFLNLAMLREPGTGEVEY
ncbi:hypothetical protein CAC42_305 [Sphaceloma murrayae]|uniref:N-acetyltransferase domain-containing protein n=1 Tax=Sphaceloma murrayae TaxID=2082308 RepID=A0A2K1QZX0_9PEZI|nr:hypothetical protein CAC42_305 [Sphaceloma murrayae]